ncbi:hypothetical protein ACQ86N_42730 [Puia sp. P3]|uniref:hypothetical protein n=1 Tax=Puia sp. P3 TaxID=3423952 RepID=UPI003D67E53A
MRLRYDLPLSRACGMRLLLATRTSLLAHPGAPSYISSPDTSILPKQNMKAIRSMAPAGLADELYLTDAGRQGIFVADASDKQSPDDSAMVLVTASGKRFRRMTNNGTVDVRWFGAIPGDGKDDWAAIQKAVDFCTNYGDKYTTVHLGPGVYEISQPIMLYRLAGNGYGFHSTNLEGESSFWESSGNGTTIQCDFKDKFAIGVQLGKGNKIRRLKIIGGFKPPSGTSSLFTGRRSTSSRTQPAGIPTSPLMRVSSSIRSAIAQARSPRTAATQGIVPGIGVRERLRGRPGSTSRMFSSAVLWLAYVLPPTPLPATLSLR